MAITVYIKMISGTIKMTANTDPNDDAFDVEAIVN